MVARVYARECVCVGTMVVLFRTSDVRGCPRISPARVSFSLIPALYFSTACLSYRKGLLIAILSMKYIDLLASIQVFLGPNLGIQLLSAYTYDTSPHPAARRISVKRWVCGPTQKVLVPTFLLNLHVLGGYLVSQVM